MRLFIALFTLLGIAAFIVSGNDPAAMIMVMISGLILFIDMFSAKFWKRFARRSSKKTEEAKATAA